MITPLSVAPLGIRWRLGRQWYGVLLLTARIRTTDRRNQRIAKEF